LYFSLPGGYMASLEQSELFVLIADDELDVHLVTKMILQGHKYKERNIELINAMSAEESKIILSENRNIALILLDVVMESDHSGHDVVNFVREELKNDKIQIVIRSGQPGISESSNFGNINGMIAKTELSASKLRDIVDNSLYNFEK